MLLLDKDDCANEVSAEGGKLPFHIDDAIMSLLKPVKSFPHLLQ